MAKKKYARKKSSGAGPIIGGSLAVVASIALASGLGYLALNAYSRPGINKETKCPETGPVSVTAFLIDTTDPISKKTLTDAKNRFEAEIGSIAVGELLEIYGLTEKSGELKTMFAGCNPGDGSTVDQWTNNPRLRQRQWEEAFGKPLEEVSGNLEKGQGGNQSPIMAAIQSIKLQVFDKYNKLDIPKQMIVMSDMIEHTDLYSQYKSGIDFGTYKATPAYADFRTSLDNVEVSIWYIDRGLKRFNGPQHMEFWAEWVMDNRGTFGSSRRLEGVNPQGSTGGNS